MSCSGASKATVTKFDSDSDDSDDMIVNSKKTASNLSTKTEFDDLDDSLDSEEDD